MQGRNQPRDEGARMARTKFSYQETLARESCSLEGELHQAGAASGLFCSGRHPLHLEKYTAHRRCSVSVTPTGLPLNSFYTEDSAKALGRCRHKLWGILRTGRTGRPGVDRPKPILPHHLPLSKHDTGCKRLWQHRTNDCLEKTCSPQGGCEFNSSLCLSRVARAFALQMPYQGYSKQSPCGKWNPACGKGEF